jgi:hypothetical protein
MGCIVDVSEIIQSLSLVHCDYLDNSWCVVNTEKKRRPFCEP